MISEVPPGAKGTTKRIGFAGQPCALAPSGTATASTASASNARRARIGVFILLVLSVGRLVLVAAQPAVHREHGAGDVSGARRGEEHGEVCELPGLAVAAHGNLVLRLLLAVLA